MKLQAAIALSVLALGCGGSSSNTTTTQDAGADSPPADAAVQDGADGGGSLEAGGDASDGATEAGLTPIVAPNDAWTWIPMDGARCGNGSPTGIAVNPHAGATHMIFYMQGGGACTDGPTCFGPHASASNMNGYGANDWANEITIYAAPFQRNTMGNPFKDANYVFVPYCTGDIHIGTAIASYMLNGQPVQAYHYGGHNVDLALARLAITWKSLDRIWATGVSAGGFSTIMNQDFVARAFPGVRVDIIDDSGPAIDDSALGAPVQWGPQLPPNCSGCIGFHEVFAYDRMTYPMSRYGLLTYQTDTTLPSYYNETQQVFAMQIATFITSLASDPNAKAFEALSSGHVVLAEQDATAAPFILPWLTKMATDDPTWANEQH